MMKLIDISRRVQEAPVYPGMSPVQIETLAHVSKGDPYSISMITSGSHNGSHADAHTHFLNNAKSIDQMDLSLYYGPCRVLTVPADAMISRKTLEGKIDNCKRLVIHGGGNSYFTKEATDYILEKGVMTVVTEALSVAPPDNEIEIHVTMLTAGVAVIENVTLEGVADGEYTLCAFPIKYAGLDGAPVRAVLIKD